MTATRINPGKILVQRAESIKNTEAINESEERKDFPEVICIK